MQKIRTGIIGFGLSGAVFHAPIITEISCMELAAIVSSQPEKVKATYPNAHVYEKVEHLIEDKTIDLVVISSPNEFHYPFAKMALMANKHVVVEKPFVLNSEQGEHLISLAQEKNRILSVYQNRRWDNDFLVLQECIKENRLGDIQYCEIRFERFRPQVSSAKWREQEHPGAGIVYDLGSHLIDQALCLFGWPESIYADIAAQRLNAVVEDYFHIMLNYGSLRVVLHAGSLVKKTGPRFLVHGTKGSFIKYGLDPQEAILRALHEKPENNPLVDVKNYFDNIIQVTTDVDGHELTASIDKPMGCYREYYEKLCCAILNNGDPPVTALEALDTIKIIEFAFKSHQEKRQISLRPLII